MKGHAIALTGDFGALSMQRNGAPGVVLWRKTKKMTERAYFVDRPQPIAAKIEKWRQDARRIRAQANEALDTRSVQAERLLEIEETAGEIYREIAVFDEQTVLSGDTSAAIAAERAAISDALRLVLMEITELSTAMYSVRSLEPEPLEPDPPDSSRP